MSKEFVNILINKIEKERKLRESARKQCEREKKYLEQKNSENSLTKAEKEV